MGGHPHHTIMGRIWPNKASWECSLARNSRKASRLQHVAIYYDAETDAAMLKNNIGEPTENQALISVGRELRKLVENNGTNLHWVKVKGHSGDVINDKADELATIGMHGKDQHGRNKSPRQLKYRQIVSHHYDKAEERRQAKLRATENERVI